MRATTPTAWIPQSKPIIFTEIGCPAVNKGANSPNLFPDPKSSENAIPPYSNGTPDDFIQRALIKAYLDYWAQDSSGMIDHSHTAIWCVDARPFPVFPARSDIWQDSHLFATGHWISGRGGFTTLKDIITDIANRANLTVNFDPTTKYAINGYVIAHNLSVSDMLSDLVEFFDLQLTNHNNLINVVNGKKEFFALNENNIVRIVKHQRGGRKSSGGKSKNNAFIDQKYTHHLPESLRMHYLNCEKNVQKDAFLIKTSDNPQEKSVRLTMPIVAFQNHLQVFAEAYLYQLRASRFTDLTIQVYRQNLKAGEGVSYKNKHYKIIHITYENDLMTLSLALLTSRAHPKIVPAINQTAASPQYVLNQKIIEYVTIDTQKYIGLYAQSSLKTYYLYRTPVQGSQSDYVGIINSNMIIGQTETDFHTRPTDILDTGHDLWITLPHKETLQSLPQADVLAGKNHLAIYNAALNLWELISFQQATLVDPNTHKYQLSEIRRGLQNTQSAMGSPVPAGAKIVIFNNALTEINADYIHNIN